MITLLIGENSFEIERELKTIAASFNGRAEKFDGADLSLNQLPDLLMGQSLFSTSRLIIIRGLSTNKSIWPVFGDWLSKVSDDIQLVLVEPKPDKRTVAFKSIKDAAVVKEYIVWSDRDIMRAEKWTIDEAKNLGFDLDKKSAQALVGRVGADQWGIFHALEKLSMVDAVTPEIIMDIIEPSSLENVFSLFETAVRGDKKQLQSIIRNLEQTEDVYRLSALLFSQGFQLAAIAAAGNDDNVAKDFGIHPFVVSKLSQIAKKIGKSGVAQVIGILAEADDDMKLSRAEPWLLIERALMKIANT